MLQQYLPFTVLKRLWNGFNSIITINVATVLTVYGIETAIGVCQCHDQNQLQQYLLFTVCDEGCEAAEERSDDEDRTSLVPDWREGKTKRIEWKRLPLAVLKRESNFTFFVMIHSKVATVPTACGMRRRVRGSRGAKRRWGPHISSPWPKGRENKGDEVTAPTACGIETCQRPKHFCSL